MLRGERSCAERREKPREQGIGSRRRRRRTRVEAEERARRAIRQRTTGQERERERENEEKSGKNARWHEGRCESWRETAKRDRKSEEAGAPKAQGWLEKAS